MEKKEDEDEVVGAAHQALFILAARAAPRRLAIGSALSDTSRTPFAIRASAVHCSSSLCVGSAVWPLVASCHSCAPQDDLTTAYAR